MTFRWRSGRSKSDNAGMPNALGVRATLRMRGWVHHKGRFVSAAGKSRDVCGREEFKPCKRT